MNSHLLDMLPHVGVYTLILNLHANIRLKVGGLGEQKFGSGYYAYTGSALGVGASSLRKRVTRHLQHKKRKFWHIDYLSVHKDVVVTSIIATQTHRRLECKMNQHLKNEIRQAEIVVLGFGASDCKENCGSHLLYLGEKNAERKIASLYNENVGCKTVAVDLTKISNLPSFKYNLSATALPITVQHASLKDLEVLCRIEKECFTYEAFSRVQIAHFLRDLNAVSLVAQVDGETAGFIMGSIEQHGKSLIGHIYTIDVASKHRRMGVGINLLKEIEKNFVGKGAETCFLEVRTNNLAARRLYQKHGYVELGKLNNYYARGIHGVQLRKKLKT